MAYWHRPRFSSVQGGGDSTYDPFWRDLYSAHADVVLNGHMHWYERFGLQNPAAQADPNGIREFIVGTGGESYVVPSSPAVNSEVLHYGTYGVLKLALHPGGYDWAFVPDTGSVGGSFTDSGSDACHNAAPGPDVTPPTTNTSCANNPCSSTWYTASVTVALSATDNAGGSGVDKTYYTTDGSTPTTTSPTYVLPFSVAETTTVRFFSTDLAGNTETTKSQQILIDGGPPSATLTSPASGTTVKKGGKVTLSASASDVGTGSGAPSGVAKVSFYLDGSTLLGTRTGSPYQVSWNTGSASRGTHTLTAVATDVAGNSHASAPVTVTLK
jgi:Bacterial Ig domain/Chitobiase/beta-hexosaminidase C-terminal domain